jgi:hypothetical protein
MKYLLLLFFVVLLASCSKDETPATDYVKKDFGGEIENPSDTILTPEERFSFSLMSDFLNSSEDDDLADFVESEIYKTAQNYNGTAMVEITPSTWLVTFEKEGTSKNYLLQKYVDIKSNECYFNLKETSLTISDVVSRKSLKSPAGEE